MSEHTSKCIARSAACAAIAVACYVTGSGIPLFALLILF